VKRKQAAVCESPRDILNTGISVTPVGDGEYISITLDPTTDQLFILGDGTVTHNSSFTLSMMKNLANKKIPTAQFALEMNSMSLATKLLSFNTQIPITYLTKEIESLLENQRKLLEFEKMRLSKNKYLWLDDTPARSLAQIREQTMMLQDRIYPNGGSGYIVIPIDLFGKIRDFAGSDNFARDYENKLNEVQVMVREIGVHYILVAQINREVGKGKLKRPKMANLKNAGAFEEVADNIFAVHRPYYDADKALKEESKKKSIYMDDEDDGEVINELEKFLAEIIILKQRMGANNKIINFFMDPNTTKFDPWDNLDQETLEKTKYINLNREEDD
jgi:replicative DNA helicase